MHQLDDRTTYGILQVNVEGTVRTTRAVVPFLINQRRGAIINVSSGSGNHPTPMISCYASTKVSSYVETGLPFGGGHLFYWFLGWLVWEGGARVSAYNPTHPPHCTPLHPTVVHHAVLAVPLP